MKSVCVTHNESGISRPGFTAMVFTAIFILSILLAGVLVLSSRGAEAAGGTFGGGNGTPGDPYLIEDVDDLQAMNDDLTAYYKLKKSFSAAKSGQVTWGDGLGFMPIGTDDDPFTGGLDGESDKGEPYIITGLVINRQSTDNVGLFGCIDSYVEISNVGLIDAKITGRNNVGALVGLNYGTVTDSYSAGTSGTIKGTNNVGGLVGDNYRGYVADSYAACKVEGNDAVGGLVGENNEGRITSSYASGNVQGINTVGGLIGWNYDSEVSESRAAGTVSGISDVGGLIGWNDYNGEVSDSYATGAVSASSDAGGLVGENWGTVTGSYAEGDVKATNDCTGGFAGRNYGSGILTDSYAKGDVEGRNAVGGFVGENNAGTVTRSYAAGSAKGSEDCVGGLVGRNYNYGDVIYTYATAAVNGSGLVGGLVGENNGGTVTYSFAAGAVNGSELVGGLIGRNYNGGTVTYCFYDQQTSGQSDTGKGVPKTTAELKTVETFTTFYWDIEENLTNLNRGYPYLSWQLTEGLASPVWYIYNPLCPPPDIPTNPYPLGGATNVPVIVTLDWANCADAILYNIYFATTSTPTYRGSTTASSYTLSNLPPSTTFYWRVVAVNDCGSTWGPIYSFSTQCVVPPAPQVPYPGNNSTVSTTNISVSWNASTNALLYNVYLGTSATLTRIGNTSNISYQLPALNYSTTYYWRVEALSSATCGNNGSVWKFTTAAAPTPTPTPTPTPSITPTPTPTEIVPTVEESGTPTWLWLIIALDVILTVAMVAAVYMVAKRRNKKKKGPPAEEAENEESKGSKKRFRLPSFLSRAKPQPESPENEE